MNDAIFRMCTMTFATMYLLLHFPNSKSNSEDYLCLKRP